MGNSQFGKPNTNLNSGRDTIYPKGVYINNFILDSIENPSNDFGYDIAILIKGHTIDQNEKKRFKRQFINGYHKKDPQTGIMVDYGKGQKGKKGSLQIKRLLDALGLDSMMAINPSNGQLTEIAKEDMVGKEIFILEYETTDTYQSNGEEYHNREIWSFYASIQEGKNPLLEKWKSFSKEYLPQKYAWLNENELSGNSNPKFKQMFDNVRTESSSEPAPWGD